MWLWTLYNMVTTKDYDDLRPQHNNPSVFSIQFYNFDIQAPRFCFLQHGMIHPIRTQFFTF